jgi:hypothetical protein
VSGNGSGSGDGGQECPDDEEGCDDNEGNRASVDHNDNDNNNNHNENPEIWNPKKVDPIDGNDFYPSTAHPKGHSSGSAKSSSYSTTTKSPVVVLYTNSSGSSAAGLDSSTSFFLISFFMSCFVCHTSFRSLLRVLSS